MKIFVINVLGAHEKRKQVEKELNSNNIPFEIYNGVDGRKIKKPSINLNWYEPNYHYHTTMGETGCGLSHLGIWEKMIRENIEQAIVFEDDVVICDTMFLKTIEHLKDLSKNPYDFVFLGRKKMTDQEEIVLEKLPEIAGRNLKQVTLKKPSFSYWCIGYWINLSGAKKLCRDNVYKKNIFTPDEYVPYMLGNSLYEDKIKKTSGFKQLLESNRLEGAAFDPPLVKPRNNAFGNSSTFFSLPTNTYRKDVTLITVATDKNDCLKRYIQSCKLYGFSPIVLGLNTKWNGGNMKVGIGGGQKVNLLKKFIHNYIRCGVDSNMLIVFTDSYDVIANDHINVLVENYMKHYEGSIVFGSETSCWPNTRLADKYPEPSINTSSNNTKSYKCDNKYLNSGVFMGHLKDIYHILQTEIKDYEDDQLYYTQYFLAANTQHFPEKKVSNIKIQLDYLNKLFVCLNNNEAVKFNNHDNYLSIKNNAIDEITRPTFIHANGLPKIKLELNNISNYTINGYNKIYGYKNKESVSLSLNSPENLPKILLVFDECHGFYFPSIYSVLNQSYPKEKIHFLYAYKNSSPYNKMKASYYLQNKSSDGLKGQRCKIEIDYEAKFSAYASYDEIEYDASIDSDGYTFKQIEFYKQQYSVDYVFYINTIVVLNNNQTIQTLIQENKSVIAPVVQEKNKFKSNFWGDIDKHGYYQRSHNYFDILNNKTCSCWNVPYVWYCFLMKASLYKSTLFMGKNMGDGIDMIFTNNMRDSNNFMWALNTQPFGNYVDLQDRSDFKEEHYSTVCVRDNIILNIYDDDLNAYANIKEWETKYFTPEFLSTFYGDQQEYFKPDRDDLLFINMFSKAFCRDILERAIINDQWSPGGDNHYDERIRNVENAPTQDIHLNQLGVEKMWEFVVDRYIHKIMWNVYRYTTRNINIVFVVKYSMDGQNELKPHHDSSTYTVNLCLNDNFEGGGCEFIHKKRTVVNKNIGQICIHPGKYTHYHKGLPLKSGVRYILVSFIN